MSSANTLTLGEIRLIKGMLALTPRLTNQAILSYFSRPGRDLNHRIIAEIRGGRWRAVATASPLEARLFMAASARRLPPSALTNLAPTWSGAGPLRRWLGLLHLDWWPVGQGLFSSGVIELDNGPSLAWVYDCGSLTRDVVLQDALDAFEIHSKARGVKSLRLAVLSHFDLDHITGLVRLLGRFPVKTLLLPYIPAWRRLAIAVSQGIAPENPLWTFYLDPAAYLVETPGIRVEEIVYVQGSGPDDLPEATVSGPLAPVDPDDLGYFPDFDGDVLKVEEGDPPEEAADDPSTTSRPSVRIRFLAPGGRLVAPLLWEFVPYNDARLASKVTPAFVSRAENLRRALLDRSRSDHARVLRILKRHYENKFRSPESRNAISLYLYSGPLSPQIRLIAARDSQFLLGKHMERFSQMHTGDAFLDTDSRWTAFNRFYSRGGRLARSAFLQVMHHGSKKNWHAGLADQMAPTVSIFSSEPSTHSKHPDAEVLRDFWAYGPVQVDSHDGYHLSGALCARDDQRRLAFSTNTTVAVR